MEDDNEEYTIQVTTTTFHPHCSSGSRAVTDSATTPVRSTWVIQQGYEQLRKLDRFLHNCVMERGVSGLPDMSLVTPNSVEVSDGFEVYKHQRPCLSRLACYKGSSSLHVFLCHVPLFGQIVSKWWSAFRLSAFSYGKWMSIWCNDWVTEEHKHIPECGVLCWCSKVMGVVIGLHTLKHSPLCVQLHH